MVNRQVSPKAMFWFGPRIYRCVKVLSFLRLVRAVRRIRTGAGCALVSLSRFSDPCLWLFLWPLVPCASVITRMTVARRYSAGQAGLCCQPSCRVVPRCAILQRLALLGLGSRPGPAVILLCSLLRLRCSQASSSCRVLQSSFKHAGPQIGAAEPGWSFGAR